MGVFGGSDVNALFLVYPHRGAHFANVRAVFAVGFRRLEIEWEFDCEATRGRVEHHAREWITHARKSWFRELLDQ